MLNVYTKPGKWMSGFRSRNYRSESSREINDLTDAAENTRGIVKGWAVEIFPLEIMPLVAGVEPFGVE